MSAINAFCEGGPLLSNDTCSGRFLVPLGTDILGPILARTDVLRTNDVMIPMSIPTTLDRAAKLLAMFEGPDVSRNRTPPSRPFERVLGVQDEVYLGAALSMAFSVMRMPLQQQPTDDQMVGPRLLSRRMDEVTRAVRWHRLAPPMGVGYAPGSALLSDGTNAGMDSPAASAQRVLFDRARLDHATSRHFCDRCNMYQGAPAVVSRGLPSLPKVVGKGGRVPFVVAARHTNGAISVGALGRTNDTSAALLASEPECREAAAKYGFCYFSPAVSLTVDCGDLPAAGPSTASVAGGPTVHLAVGLFGGGLESVILRWSWPGRAPTWLSQKLSVLGQDLRSATSHLITGAKFSVVERFATLEIGGRAIAALHNASSDGDLSEPGVLVSVATLGE